MPGLALWEFGAQIEALLNASVDRETGEIVPEALAEIEALEGERDAKALAIAAYAHGQGVEADAVRAQAKRLAERAARHERHAERLVEYLQSHLPDGTTLRDPRVEIIWRTSTAVEVDVDPTELPEDYVRIRCEADKPALKAALAAGEQIKGVRLVKRRTLAIR
jgi:TPR repeat protein